MSKSRLIIKGADNGKVLYSGQGTRKQWREKVRYPMENVYRLTELTIDENGCLQIINENILLAANNSGYNSTGADRAVVHLDDRTKSLLLDLINSSQ